MGTDAHVRRSVARYGCVRVGGYVLGLRPFGADHEHRVTAVGRIGWKQEVHGWQHDFLNHCGFAGASLTQQEHVESVSPFHGHVVLLVIPHTVASIGELRHKEDLVTLQAARLPSAGRLV